MKMILLGTGVHTALPSTWRDMIGSNSYVELLSVDLDNYRMQEVEVTLYREEYTGKVTSSLLVLPDELEIRVLGDIRNHPTIVLREPGYEF